MYNSRKTFYELGIKNKILKSLKEIGYFKPSLIQLKCIPYLLKGYDILGTAQTGSGKTAAFALPLIQKINLKIKKPQILVLTPTRELAIQISVAFKLFSKYMNKIKTLSLYGGQSYDIQFKKLKHNPQIIVGTPGRLLDHLKKKTLNLSKINSLVLDEADEMLRMGFIEDVKSILFNIPNIHQTILFSATMPKTIKKIAKNFMKFPKEILIKSNFFTKPNIQQYYCETNKNKFYNLIKFLEIEEYSAVIIFVKTKISTLEIADNLKKYGFYNSSALNGDMNQNMREKTLEKFKLGYLDILVATDIAARGLDVKRINLVINYDIPIDVESYVHRIGRTGRAGRSGKAILFMEKNENMLLKNIERFTKVNIKKILFPSNIFVSKKRQYNFIKKINKNLLNKNINKYKKLLIIIKKYYNNKLKNFKNIKYIFLKMLQIKKKIIISYKKISILNNKYNYFDILYKFNYKNKINNYIYF
ncbi:DEAD/DEAH box helicase [Candidatus Annandia adelgestsuga]|uniref:DEAD/DEAH box helicase n=1 Tax=Candidatus Annandia adelgestsuga TaxID=1302411 RepID=UPI000F7DA12C|nr:DEAD/DEAH box helicase [Candidatus Annandia adelgestsuga]